MKSHPIAFLLLISVVLLTMPVSGQKSLEFNQAKLVTSTLETVPSGKVWKVEGTVGNRITQYMVMSDNNNNFTAQDQQISINGTAVSVIQSVGGGAGFGTGSATYNRAAFLYAASAANFPLWLPAGTTLQAGINISFISVIEFNIIP